MNDLNRRLRDADPMRVEPGLPADTRDAMRRAIVAAADAGVPHAPRWHQPMALAAMTVLAVLGAAAAHNFSDRRHDLGAIVARDPAPQPAATHVQFRTPGGTRIIWTIDPAFHLGGPRP